MQNRNEYKEIFVKIDSTFCANDEYINFTGIEKITNEEERKDIMDIEETKDYNLITKCFFTTHALLKFGHPAGDIICHFHKI
jgi:hypothetical protein